MSRLLRETAPVCLISAPSGAGKTLAVSQWLEADERPSAWLHLDRGDNDPVTLLRYMARALEGVAEVPSAVFAWLQLPQPPVVEAILPALTIAAVTAPPFIFVIDDVQRVREARCWSASWPTLTTLPEGSTVVLCGRADPPLPLARLRAEGRLAEYHFGDLAFDGDEAGELLRLRGLGATPELVESLLETTEGWAAGLYLAVAVLGRQGAPVLPLTPGTAAREISDYVADEVLSEQPDELVEFLTRTSIVERLSPDLCDAITGGSDGLDLLRRAERENLFVVALDRDRGWYRYHRLFAAALQAELVRREPESVPELHRRAASWFEQHDQVRHAVSHWLAAGDPGRAADLVAARWLSRYDHGRLLAARLWLDEFEPWHERAHLPLAVASAWLRALSGEAAAAAHVLGEVDPAALDAPSPDGTASLRSSSALLDALLGSAGPGAMLEQARLARDLESRHGRVHLWLDFANEVAGVAETLSGDRADGLEALRLAARRGASMRSSMELAALGHLSLLAGDEGRWDEAQQYALEATEKAAAFALEDYLPSIPARMARDRLSARAGDDDAVADLEEVLESLDPQLCPWLGPQIALVLAEIATDRRDDQEARRWLREARWATDRWAAPALVGRCAELEKRLGRSTVAEPISTAEMRVLELLPSYLTLTEIAERLALSPNTVGSHVRSLHRKLGASSRSETVERAIRLGLLGPRAD